MKFEWLREIEYSQNWCSFSYALEEFISIHSSTHQSVHTQHKGLNIGQLNTAEKSILVG